MKVIIISVNNIKNLKFELKGINVLLQESKNLNKNDIIKMLKNYTLDYNDIHVNLIYAITGGKPSLVYALFEYLKNNDWSIMNKLGEIFKLKFTNDLQEDIQDRIMDLIEDEDAKELLYRVALISFPYNFQLIEKIAQITPNVVHVNEKIRKLGGWIKKDDQIYCNVSLLDKVAEKNLDHEIQIEIHRIIVKSIFDVTKTLDYINFNRTFIHLVKAEENNQAGLLLCNALHSLKESNIDDDYWHILDLWNELECPQNMNIEIKLLICVLQIICCDKFEKNNNHLFIRLDGYIKDIINIGCNNKLIVILFLSVHYSLKNVKLSMKYLKILMDNNTFNIFEEYREVIDIDEQLGVEKILFLCSANIKTKEERQIFFLIYNAMNDKQKEEFNSLSDQDLYDMSLAICSKIWLNELEGGKNFNNALKELESLEDRSVFKDNKWFFINNKKCQIILYGEYLNNIDKAEIIAKELLESDLCKERPVEFLIRDVIGRQFSIAKNAERAQLYLNNLSLDFEGFELEKIDYLTQYSIIKSKYNEHELALEELEYASRLIDKNQLPYIEKLKNLGEQIIEYWFEKDNNSMYEKIKEYIDLIEEYNSEELNNEAKSLVLCLGHCTGYYSSILTRGKAPIKGSDGSPYVEPFRGIFINDDGKKALMYDTNKFALIYSHLASIAEVLKKYNEAKIYYNKSASLYNLKNGIKGVIERNLLKYEIMNGNYDKSYDLTISQSENIYFSMNKEMKEDTLFNIGNDIFKFFIIPSIFNVLKKYIMNDASYINDSIKIVELIKKQNYIKEDDILIISEIINQNIINERYVNKEISKSNKCNSSLLLIKYVSLVKLDLKRNLREALSLQFAFEDYLKKLYDDELFIYNIIKSTLQTFWIYAYCKYRDNFKNTDRIDKNLKELLNNNNYELKELLKLMNFGLN
ncbi:serine protease [uncultured Clostridium sp.]|uniref:serine protease n=1 Tax=uncultured Clostridium sp. TaxID=59620 RepID=UPI0028E56B84|nr:serine protease [uncultured Clostridium sp.]